MSSDLNYLFNLWDWHPCTLNFKTCKNGDSNAFFKVLLMKIKSKYTTCLASFSCLINVISLSHQHHWTSDWEKQNTLGSLWYKSHASFIGWMTPQRQSNNWVRREWNTLSQRKMTHGLGWVSVSYHFCFLHLVDLMGIYLTAAGGSWESPVPAHLRSITVLPASVSLPSADMHSISQDSPVMDRFPGEPGSELNFIWENNFRLLSHYICDLNDWQAQDESMECIYFHWTSFFIVVAPANFSSSLSLAC